MSNKRLTYLEPMAKNCPTCPFLKCGKREFLPLLLERCLTEATPICHSTGGSEIVPDEEKLCKEDRACRGARDVQLAIFTANGLLAEPTDACWKAKVDEINAIRK